MYGPTLRPDSGMVIDPVVNQLANATHFITSEEISHFTASWTTSNYTFAQLIDSVGPGLRLTLPGYYHRDLCASLEFPKSNHVIMGTNDQGDCIHWDYLDLPTKWECLNNGECAQSVNGRYFTSEECVETCASSRWVCMQNAKRPGDYAGPDASSCVQSSLGPCVTLEECEKACSPPLPWLGHYGKPGPARKCLGDEVKFSITGVAGDICAPRCNSSSSCPSDVPPDTVANSQCIFRSPSSPITPDLCALTCVPNPFNSSSYGGCPTNAECIPVGGIHVCMYQ